MPPQWIEYLPDLISALEPIQFHTCFIAHSSRDEEFVSFLYDRLVGDRVSVWYAPEDMRGGRKQHEQIESAIHIYDKLLVVLSPHSMDSEWVKSEIRWARQKEFVTGTRVLFPIRLVDMETIRAWKCFDADTGKDMAVEVREYHIPNLSDWRNKDAFEKAYQGLLADLKADAAEEIEST